MPSIETIPFLVKQLRLPAIASHWRERTQLAETKHVSYAGNVEQPPKVVV